VGRICNFFCRERVTSVMLRARLFRSVLLVLATCVTCQAQDASKIIDQYVKAAGGAKALARVQTLELEGNTPGSGEQPAGTYTFIVKLPNRYYTEWRPGGKPLIEAYNGKSAWQQSATGELGTLLGPPAADVETASQYYNARFLALAKKKIAAAVKGPATIGGRATTQVDLTFPSGLTWQVYFDAQSHLIDAEKATIAGVPREIDYDDYRSLNGVKVPYKFEVRRGSESFTVNVTKAAINETVGERVFDFPIKSQVKLPELKKLFEEIDANQKQIDRIKENYAGTQVEEETEYDKNGKVTKKEVNEYTFFYLNGEEITTLVKKDGQALGEEALKKENEKTTKRIEEAQKKEKKKEEKEERAKEEGKEANDKEDPGIEVFLRACQFVNPRRERFRGQDVLVFDFEPNPEYKAKNLEEKVVKELAGVVWIDENAKDVVRLEAYFVSDFHLAGGLLANLQKGTGFTFEQAYINSEVWLPTYVEAHVGVRVFLVKGIRVNVVTKYSDYKRFNVQTLHTIGKPKDVSETAPKPQ
jgi:hypothetical protein